MVVVVVRRASWLRTTLLVPDLLQGRLYWVYPLLLRRYCCRLALRWCCVSLVSCFFGVLLSAGCVLVFALCWFVAVLVFRVQWGCGRALGPGGDWCGKVWW
jgi:hypothetical protein